MRVPRVAVFPLILAAGVLCARPAHATFHLMQIEQVIAGVDGSTAIQAIQLRMRSNFENQVSNGQLMVRDAAGQNPVILISFPSNVTNSATGSRVLAATSGFAGATNPSLTPDFILTNPIPDSYMAAGTLTWEDHFGTVYWRICWGGAAYTGPTNGVVLNDPDGDVAPILAAGLPTANGQALLYKFAAAATSTNNANDYALTAGPAVFTNNAGQSGTIVSLVSVPGGPEESIALGSPIPNPVHGSMSYTVTVPHPMRVTVGVYDLAGRRVFNLVDATLPTGRSSFSWDPLTAAGPAMRGGVYFLAMNAGGAKQSTRFVLLGRGSPLAHDE